MPCDHLSHTSLSCLHFASSANVEGLLLRFLSRNFNVFSFIINSPQKVYKTVFIKDTILLQILKSFLTFLNLFIYYVSFYSHVCTNYF